MPRKPRGVFDPLAGAADRLRPAEGAMSDQERWLPEGGVIYRRVGETEAKREHDVEIATGIWLRPLGTRVWTLYVGDSPVLSGHQTGSPELPYKTLGQAVQRLDSVGAEVAVVHAVPTGELLHFRDPQPPFDVQRYLETTNQAYTESQGGLRTVVTTDSLKQLANTGSLAAESEDE